MWKLYRRSDLIASIEAEHLKSYWRTSGFVPISASGAVIEAKGQQKFEEILKFMLIFHLFI